jgi:hypothetical protein
VNGAIMDNYPLSIFIDTNIFILCKYNFSDSSTLGRIANLVQLGKVKLVLSDIVINETKKHLSDSARNSIESINKARNDILKKIDLSNFAGVDIHGFLDIEVNKDISNEILVGFNNFLSKANVLVLESSKVSVDSILLDYFGNKPPFEDSGKKKNEFPDAIMAHRIKMEYSKTNPIWIISEDIGFLSSFSDIDGINCLNSLNALYDLISQDDLVMYNLAQNYFDNKGNMLTLSEGIVEVMQESEIEIDGLDYDRKGLFGGYEYDEVEIVKIDLSAIELFSINEIQDTNILVTLKCRARIKSNCFFDDIDNSIWDSEEKEFLYLSEAEVVEEHVVIFEVNINLNVDKDTMSLNVSDISLEDKILLNQFTRVSQEFLLDHSDARFEFESAEFDNLESQNN